MGDNVPDQELLGLSADIVSAHVARNTLAAAGLPDLIRLVYAALRQAGAPGQPGGAPQQPAVAIKKSVVPGYLICLEDGKKLKMLKRHLQSSYGMTPDDYRTKWGLPLSYQMVASDYAMHRSTWQRRSVLAASQSRFVPRCPCSAFPPAVKVKRRKPENKIPRRSR